MVARISIGKLRPSNRRSVAARRNDFSQEAPGLKLPGVRNACRKMLQILTVSSNVAASKHHPPALTNGGTSNARLTANVGTPTSQTTNAISLAAAPRHLVLRRHRPLVAPICVGPIPREDWEKSSFHADHYLS